MHFKELTEPQILALAISSEEEDAHIYRDFAELLRGDFPASAELFEKMAAEEDGHRHRLIELYRAKFGEHIPLIKREDVKGFYVRRTSWFRKSLRPEHARDFMRLLQNKPAMLPSGNCSVILPRRNLGMRKLPAK
jgi:rubrerythrin